MNYKILFTYLSFIIITMSSSSYAGSSQVKCPSSRHLVWQMQDSRPECVGSKEKGFYVSSRPLAGDYGWTVIGPISSNDCAEAYSIANDSIHKITDSHTIYMVKYLEIGGNAPSQYGCTYKPYAAPKTAGFAVYWGD